MLDNQLFWRQSEARVFQKERSKRLVQLKDRDPCLGVQCEADLKALSEMANVAEVSHPTALEDQAAEPMEDDPLAEDESDSDDGDDNNQETLASVDMSGVPSNFRQRIARVLANLRFRMSKKSPSNQRMCSSTGSANSSREHSFQEPVNKTPNPQTPAAVRNSPHDVLTGLIETRGARENEGIMKSIADKNHLQMLPAQTWTQASTS
jgi:hypothetical protein